MTDRKLLRVFCPKGKGGHEVGAVFATSGGAALRIAVTLEGDGVTTGHTRAFRLGEDLTEVMGHAWCQACELRLPFVPGDVLRRRKAGATKHVLAADGMWKDGLGVLARKRRRNMP